MSSEDEMIARADWRQPLRPEAGPHPSFRPATGATGHGPADPRLHWRWRKTFSSDVTDMADAHGWDWQHCRLPQQDRPGFPDLVLWHPGRGLVLFRELKRDGEQTDPCHQVVSDRLLCNAAGCRRRYLAPVRLAGNQGPAYGSGATRRSIGR